MAVDRQADELMGRQVRQADGWQSLVLSIVREAELGEDSDAGARLMAA
jgi:hypothetical protein